MRSAVAILLVASLIGLCTFAPAGRDVLGQVKVDIIKKDAPPAPAKDVKTDAPKGPAKAKDVKTDAPRGPAKKDSPRKDVPEEKFDQKKADLETIKAANYPYEGKALIEFFRKHTVTDADRAKLTELIRQLGDDDFDRRELASEEIEKYGVSAIGPLRQAERTGNPEILRRCELCLKSIEKVPTRTLAAAAARLLGELKPPGTSETLVNFLPLAEDDSVGDEVRATLARVALANGKPDPVLLKALESQEALKRGAAAEAFARGGDMAMRDQMRQLLAKETDIDVKLRIAIALVTAAKNKQVVEEMIKLMAEAPVEAGWKAEEVLVRLAAEKGPNISLGGDKAARDRARDEWLKWWKANEKTVDLAKLDEMERMLGYTLIVEMDIRGIGGRVKEVTPDGKVRWEINSVQFPTDAIVVPGNRVIIAEQNTNRVSERDIVKGKEIWAENFNQPIGLQKLSNGNVLVVGRHQVVEWDRNRKPVSTVTRLQYDIVAGAKLRNGNVAVYTQQGQIVTYDKTGKQVDTFAAGRGNYNSTMQVLPNGKLVITQFRAVAEVDPIAKKTEVLMNYNFPTSAQRLPNGNILVSNQNNYQVAEMDPKTSKVVWEYKPANNNNQFYRAWRAKRR